MKKESKKRLMSLFIIIVFALSSVAFVFYGFSSKQQQIKPLDTFVVNGDLEPQLEDAYVKAGYTFLKLYYNLSMDPDIIIFAEQAPSTFTTSSGEIQMIVQKYDSAVNYATIVNVNGAEDYFNVTQDTLFEGLCGKLLATTTECAILGLNLSE